MPRPLTATAVPFLYAGQAVVISDVYKPLAAQSSGLDPEGVYEIQKVNPKTVTFKKPNGRTAKWVAAAFAATDRPFVMDVQEVELSLGQVVTFEQVPGKLFAVIKLGTTPGLYNIAEVEDSGNRYFRGVSSARLTPVRITAHEEA